MQRTDFASRGLVASGLQRVTDRAVRLSIIFPITSQPVATGAAKAPLLTVHGAALRYLRQRAKPVKRPADRPSWP